MPSVAIELLIILVLVLINGVFAMSEIVIVSSRKARLQQRADNGDAGAQAALELAHDPTRFLSTVTAPIVALLSVSTEVFMRLLRLRPSADPPVTEDELRILIEQGTEAGVFEEAEQEI